MTTRDTLVRLHNQLVLHPRVADPFTKIWRGEQVTVHSILIGGGYFSRKSRLKWCVERPRGGRKGGIPSSRNQTVGGAIQAHQYQLAPPSAQLRERGLTYGRRAVAPRTISLLIFPKTALPIQKQEKTLKF